jgi:hypothetical protein
MTAPKTPCDGLFDHVQLQQRRLASEIFARHHPRTDFFERTIQTNATVNLLYRQWTLGQFHSLEECLFATINELAAQYERVLQHVTMPLVPNSETIQ